MLEFGKIPCMEEFAMRSKSPCPLSCSFSRRVRVVALFAFAAGASAAGAATVAVTAGEHGSVSGGGDYEPGATVTLTATADEGFAFFRWTGDIGAADPAEPALTFAMPDSGVSVTALFGRRLVVAADGSGGYANLDEAVAAAVDNDTILLKPGDYRRAVAAFLTIDKPIKVVSEGGRDVTFVRGLKDPAGGVIKELTRGLKLDHPLAILKGLSLFNYGNDGRQVGENFAAGLVIKAGLAECCAVSNCIPNWGAAAVEVRGEGAEFRHSLVANNRNNGNSNVEAGIFGDAGVVRVLAGTVTNCIVRGNEAGNVAHGGGVYVCGENARLLGSVVEGNRAAGQGGGVYLAAGLVADCLITNNTGAAAGVRQTGGTLKDCRVVGNKAEDFSMYGGVYATGGTVDGCRIVGNAALPRQGVNFCMTGGTVRDTLAAATLHEIPSRAVVDIAPGVSVENCVFQCPSVNGSEELNASSFFRTSDTFWIEADKVVGLVPLTVSFKAHGADGAPCTWDFGDAQHTSSTESEPTFSFDATGRYEVTLVSGGRTAKLALYALSPTAYCAPDGGNVFPYDTPERAAKSPQDAIAAVFCDNETRGTVHVAADTFTYAGPNVSKQKTAWITVNRRVHLVGPETGEAVFNADRKIMTCWLLHPEAVLERLTISNGRLETTGINLGGSLAMTGGLVTNCVISKGFAAFGGNASVSGGAVWGSTFREGTLSASGPDRPGGGLQVHGPSLVANCLFENNSGGLGGGLSVHADGAVVSNCVVRGNEATSCGGGGVAVLKGLVTHCVVSNNASNANGGGVVVQGGTLRNLLVVDNMSKGTGTMGVGGSGKSGGGGLAVSGGTVENCTVADNVSASPTRSDALYQTGGTVRNTILLGGDATAQNDVCKTGGKATYCLFRPGLTVDGDGNKSAVPKISTSNYQPLYGSPAVDSGLSLGAVTSDLRGLPRPVNDKWDIGCFEMNFVGAFVADFEADVTAAGGETTVTLTVNDVKGGTPPYTYVWTFDGKTVETAEASLERAFGFGRHDVTLVVRDATGLESVPVTQEGYIRISSPDVYVSTTGADVWPYDTWEKATPDWNAAVGAVYATEETPGRIWVADGVYEAKDKDLFTVNLTLPIELCGTNAARQAVFDGKNQKHPVVRLGHPKAKLANVSIRNCDGGLGPGGVCLTLADGLVTNCTLAAGISSGMGLVQQEGGVLADCLLDGHNAQTHAGGDRKGGGLYQTGGLAERLTISGCVNGNGGGAYLAGASAVLRDSVIRGCVSGAGGAILLENGLVERCVLTNNTSLGSGSSVYPGGKTHGAAAVVMGGTLRNCLILDNRAGKSGEINLAALSVTGGQAYNNTVWANREANGTTNDVYVSGGAVANTIAATLAMPEGGTGTVEGNVIGLAPGFRNPQRGDFRLRPRSPAVGCGVMSYWNGVASPTDLLGQPRFQGGRLHAGCIQNLITGLMLLVR